MLLKFPEPKSPLRSLILISPFALWGTAMVFMKGVIPHTTPLFMAGVRLVPAGVLVLLVAVLMGRTQPKGWQAWLWIAAFALVDGACFQGFLAEGLVHTGAGLGSVMIDSQPLAVALMARWFFGERIGWWGWLGLGLGVVGISCIGLPDEWILGLGQQWRAWISAPSLPTLTLADAQYVTAQLFQNGQWLMLLAALSMAIGTILLRAVSRYADPVIATGWHLVVGGLPLFVLSGLRETEQWIHLSSFDWLALGYATVLGSAIAYGLFFYFAASGSLTSLSSLTFLTPIFALICGNLFLAETLSPLQWTGVSLTLVSIYLVNQREQLSLGSQKPTSVSLTPSPSAHWSGPCSEPETVQATGTTVVVKEGP